jgi:hypothetical protein
MILLFQDGFLVTHGIQAGYQEAIKTLFKLRPNWYTKAARPNRYAGELLTSIPQSVSSKMNLVSSSKSDSNCLFDSELRQYPLVLNTWAVAFRGLEDTCF